MHWVKPKLVAEITYLDLDGRPLTAHRLRRPPRGQPATDVRRSPRGDQQASQLAARELRLRAELGLSASRGNASCPPVYCRSANRRFPPLRDVPSRGDRGSAGVIDSNSSEAGDIVHRKKDRTPILQSIENQPEVASFVFFIGIPDLNRQVTAKTTRKPRGVAQVHLFRPADVRWPPLNRVSSDWRRAPGGEMSQLLSRVLSQHNSIDVLRGLISGKSLKKVAPRAGLEPATIRLTVKSRYETGVDNSRRWHPA